jgi:hypothetical protein
MCRLKEIHELGMVVHACNSSTWRLKQEDLKFKASLGYIDPISKKRKKKVCLP